MADFLARVDVIKLQALDRATINTHLPLEPRCAPCRSPFTLVGTLSIQIGIGHPEILAQTIEPVRGVLGETRTLYHRGHNPAAHLLPSSTSRECRSRTCYVLLPKQAG